MSDFAVKFENVHKEYHLGAIGGGTLRDDLQSLLARIKGKEDPNLKIGQQDGRRKEVFSALEDVSLEIKKGSAVGIIGHNGAGKSTLLKLLSRVTAPTKGNIYVNGRIASMLEVGTGFHPELSGRENVYLNGAILGMTKQEISRKFDEIVAFAEMEEFIDTPVKRYSSGMYVKLAFAVAAHLDSEILVMDEVLAVGDMKFQQKCLGKMGDAADKEGRTVLYVSHSMNTVRQLCNRCVVLDHGKVAFDGGVEDGIGVYMNQGAGSTAVFHDFREARRPDIDFGKKIFIESFTFLGKDTSIYMPTEKMRFAVRWRANESLADMRIRLEILYADSTPAGMTESKAFKNAVVGEVYDSEFEFDISNIAPGRYYFKVDAFTMNEFGTHSSVDHPLQFVYFDIEEDNKDSLIWQHSYWGHVRLNGLECVDTINIEE